MPNRLLQMNSLADLAALDHSSAALFLLARGRAAHLFAVGPLANSIPAEMEFAPLPWSFFDRPRFTLTAWVRAERPC